MTAFFDTSMKQARLLLVAGEWIGTPFAAHGALKGVGVDCVHLAAEVLKECGFWSGYAFPAYTLDAGMHMQTSLMVTWLRGQPERFEEVSDPQIGDVACFRLGRVEHHCGIVVGPDSVMHCMVRGCVRLGVAHEFLRTSKLLFRPLKKGGS